MSCFAVFQQWCGINVIFNYAEEIFRAAGYDISTVLKNIAWTGSVNLAIYICRAGRCGSRRTATADAVRFGGAGNHLSAHGLLLFQRRQRIADVAAGACGHRFLCDVTRAVIWVVISEIFPNRIRGAAMAVAVSSLWIACFLLTYTFPMLNQSSVRRERSGFMLEFASLDLFSSNSSCRKPKAKRLSKSNANWWIKFSLTHESETNISVLNEGAALRRLQSRLHDGDLKAAAVQIRVEDLVIPTYLPDRRIRIRCFWRKACIRAVAGKFIRCRSRTHCGKPVERKWKAIWIENEFLRAMVLPEIGGRIHALQDKTTGYDLIYNHVIKPALVGLAGPWISGGIEFNWPQHHRPATFLPVDFTIEEHADGSKTIWCSDHDPMCRMKGMHGVCLHPGKSFLELKVRAYNRTSFVQTFLWWANVATRVHEAYQSFFPPDVYYVADHARRSMSEYPLAQGFYYGVELRRAWAQGVP